MTDEQNKDEAGEREPTAAEAAKIAAAGAEAIKNAEDPAKAQAEAAAAIEGKAEELKVKVSREDATMIATATIEALEARGAFGDGVSEAPAEAALEPAAGEPGEHEQGAPEGEHGEHHEHAHEDVPPRKRSWASRYLGKGGDE